MPGAGGMRAANWLQSAALKDGTVIGAVSRAMAFEPLFGNKAAKYDPTKITYIGSANDEVSVCMAWHTSGVTRFEDVQKRSSWSGPAELPTTPTNSLQFSTTCSEPSSKW